MSKYVVKYQETTVESAKSVQEITDLVRNYGGRRFEQVWDDRGYIAGIRFALAHPEIGELPVSMTARTREIERILAGAGLWRSHAEKDRRERIERQAERIAWRHIKDLTEQLLLSVNLGLRTAPAAFLADVEVRDQITGETMTMWEMFERRAELETGGAVALTNHLDRGQLRELPPAGGTQ